MKKKKIVLICVVLLFVTTIIGWNVVRKTTKVSLTINNNSNISCYDNETLVMNAIALSYFVYGAERCDSLSGSVSEMQSKNKMGIIIENVGLKRTDEKDSTTALINTSSFIDRYIGEYTYVDSLKDEKSGFYGMALADNTNKCVWISFSGAVEMADNFACIGLVINPKLTKQEKLAISLYEKIMQSDYISSLNYSSLLTGHSLGGGLATFIALNSKSNAITINGVDGIALDRYHSFTNSKGSVSNVVNYMTSPKNKKISYLDFIQRLMFLGSYKDVDYHLFAQNSYSNDPHTAFSFIEIENEEYILPKEIEKK